MSRQYGCIAFTDSVDAEQDEYGSADFYRRIAASGSGAASADPLGPREKEFLQTRDSFYLATVSETGWPYVQFRGGPPGFARVLDEYTLAWADHRGNLQHVSTGNLRGNDRVAIIALDYPSRRRLKLFGRATVVRLDEDPERVLRLKHPNDHESIVERGIFVDVAAYDWNCPQHISPRFTRAELSQVIDPLKDRIRALEAEHEELRTQLAQQQNQGRGTDPPGEHAISQR